MGKLTKTRIRWSAQEWSRTIARFERGGQIDREFCEREGLALSTLQRRRCKVNAVHRKRRRRDSAWFVYLTNDGADDDRIAILWRLRHATSPIITAKPTRIGPERADSVFRDFVIEPALNGPSNTDMSQIVQRCFRQLFATGEIEQPPCRMI